MPDLTHTSTTQEDDAFVIHKEELLFDYEDIHKVKDSASLLIEQRLRDAVPDFKTVASASGLDTILKGHIQVPAAYVYNLNRTVSDNRLLSAVRQRVRHQVAVVIATRNYEEKRGAEAFDENDFYCSVVSGALLGWEPTPQYEALEYSGGNLVVFKNGLFLWREIYETYNYISKV